MAALFSYMKYEEQICNTANARDTAGQHDSPARKMSYSSVTLQVNMIVRQEKCPILNVLFVKPGSGRDGKKH